MPTQANNGTLESVEAASVEMLDPQAAVMSAIANNDDAEMKKHRKMMQMMRMLGLAPKMGRIHPTAETARQKQKWQNRSKYNGDGSLRTAEK